MLDGELRRQKWLKDELAKDEAAAACRPPDFA
jgi:hypothetical protein